MNTTDGALARRIPVLLFAVSMFVVLAIMLRRKRIDGLDPGAVWRALGASLLTILFLSFTPTKWTIQFGIFAGLGAALAAVACVAIGQAARRTLRNLSILVAGLLVACAAAAAGKNAWPWPYNFGIAWFDKAPVVAGIQVSTVLLALAVVALLFAIWQHLRMDFVDETGLAHDRGAAPAGWRIGVASAPIAVIAVLIVVSELAVFAKAATSRADTFTLLSANLDSARGNTCAMADSVLVEPDPNRGMLTPADGGTASSTLQGQSQGFRPDGVKPDLTPQAGAQKPGAMNTSADLSKTFIVLRQQPGNHRRRRASRRQRQHRGTAIRPRSGDHTRAGQPRDQQRPGHSDHRLVSPARPRLLTADRHHRRRRGLHARPGRRPELRAGVGGSVR